MLKTKRSRERLIFNMGTPIPGKDGHYIETGSWVATECTFPNSANTTRRDVQAAGIGCCLFY